MKESIGSIDRLERLQRGLEQAVEKTTRSLEKLERVVQQAAAGSELSMGAGWGGISPQTQNFPASGRTALSLGVSGSLSSAKRWEAPMTAAMSPAFQGAGSQVPAQQQGSVLEPFSGGIWGSSAPGGGQSISAARSLISIIPKALASPAPLDTIISGLGNYMQGIDPELFGAGNVLGGRAGNLGGILSAVGVGSPMEGGLLAGVNPEAAALGFGLDWLISSFKPKKNNFAESAAQWTDIQKAYSEQEQWAQQLGHPEALAALPDPAFWVQKKHGVFGQVTSKTQYLGNLPELEGVINQNAQALEEISAKQKDWALAMDEFSQKVRMNLSDFDETHEKLEFVNQMLQDYGDALSPEQLAQLQNQQEILESPYTAFQDEAALFTHQVRMGELGTMEQLDFWRGMLEKYSASSDAVGLGQEDIWSIEETIHGLEQKAAGGETGDSTKYYSGAPLSQTWNIDQSFSIGAWLGDEAGIDRLAAEIGARIRDLGRNSVTTVSGGLA